MRTVVPAAVRGHSTFLANLASQNAPSVTTGRGHNDVDVWTSAVDVRFDRVTVEAVVDRAWSPPPVDL